MGVNYALGIVEPDEVRPEDLITRPVPMQNPLGVLADAGAAAELAQVAPHMLQTSPGGGIPQMNPNAPPPVFPGPEPDVGVPAGLAPPAPAMAQPSAPIEPLPTAKAKPVGGGGGGSTSEKTLRGDLNRIQTEQEKLAGQKGDLGVQRAGIEQQIADNAVKLQNEAAARQAQVSQQADAAVAKRQAQADAEEQKYKGMSPIGFFQSRGADGQVHTDLGRTILAAISIGIGAYASTKTRGPNMALQIIERAVDRDYQTQRDAIMKQKDVVTLARQGVEGARQAKADKLLDLESWRKNAFASAEAQAKSMLAKQSVPEAEWDKNALVAGTHAKALESKMSFDKNLAELEHTRASTSLMRAQAAETRTRAATGPNGKLTEGQASSAGLLNDLVQSYRTLKTLPRLEDKDLKLIQDNETKMHLAESPKTALGTGIVIGARALDQVPRIRTQGLDEKKAQAALEWDKAQNIVTYILTGKGMNIEEARTKARQMAPAAGDPPGMYDIKSNNIEQFINNHMIQAGGAATQIAANMSAPAPASNKRQQVLEASQWLQAHPKDPRADQVRRKIAELSAGGL